MSTPKAILVTGLLAASMLPASAALISYKFHATVTANGDLDPLGTEPIAAGDAVEALLVVDASVLGTGTSTYAYRPNAIVGGYVKLHSYTWDIPNSGSGMNYVAQWNNDPAGSGKTFDGIWFTTSFIGPSLNAMAPTVLTFVLFSYQNGENTTFSGLDLPLQLNLDAFNGLASGSLPFGDASSDLLLGLSIDSVEVSTISEVPAPGTAFLTLAAIVGLRSSAGSFAQRATKRIRGVA